MLRFILVCIFFFSQFLIGAGAFAAQKKSRYLSKWSVALTNGYTFYENKKSGVGEAGSWGGVDGQMNLFFSSIEIARNFNNYEIGGKIQLLGPSFVSPFVKWNIIRQSKSTIFKPSIMLGVVPSELFGVYARVNFGLQWNHYITLNPFVGVYSWYKIAENPKYEKQNLHVNAGFSLNLYF